MIKERLQKLRLLLLKRVYAGYIVPSSDEYMSEYTPSYAKRLEYITGFTGSNGVAVILPEIVLFFTDGRYLTQSHQQLDSGTFEVHNIKDFFTFDWQKYVKDDQIIAYDPRLFNKNYILNFKNISLTADEENLIDLIWQEQPPRPNSEIFKYEDRYAGQPANEKIEYIRKIIVQEKSDALLICDSASICWLLNIRANDVDFCPILLCNLLITCSEIYLFTDEKRDITHINLIDLMLLDIKKLPQMIDQIQGKILYDENQTSIFLDNLLQKKDSKHLINPCILPKACKNSMEIELSKQGHIHDGAAICESLAYFENNDLSDKTEFDIGEILTENRKLRKSYVMDSFAPICGYQSNGAIIHYRAEKQSSKKIEGCGLLLLDSGGHYQGATTDITRVILIGENNKEYIEYYTRVLKGHIALAMAKFFKSNVNGSHLDVLARQYLWENGADYGHGTGHGVGNFLSVHEGPQSISLTSKATLMPGMILSNEPGYYREGEFGIRIENLMFVKELSDNILGFEMLTLVPYAKNLIDFTMLTKNELNYLKDYYNKIRSNIMPLLTTSTKKWLENQLNIDGATKKI